MLQQNTWFKIENLMSYGDFKKRNNTLLLYNVFFIILMKNVIDFENLQRP